MIPKPIRGKGLWNFIRGIFNREYELVSNLSWHDANGECIKAMLLAYHQLISEEDARVRAEMDKRTSKN